MERTKVGFVFNKELLYLANKLPPVKGRAFFVHQLIRAYKLLEHCYYITVEPANDDDLRKFHSSDYVDFIKKDINIENEDDEHCEMFGFNYDCPPFEGLYRTIAYLAGSAKAAANALIHKQCQIVINWFGGWHHGFKDEASGYCYTNDIVFSILTFLDNGYRRILYVDLDLHHGNGVEGAFAYTNKVLTLSLHKYEFGFFPGTGSIDDIGLGNKGKYYSINMPLANGINDDQYIYIFDQIIQKLIPKYHPEVIICQCGADGLSGDKMNSFNLTLKSYEHCVEKLMTFNIPILFLGGGGYNAVNTAKLWTMITAKTLGKDLDINIPDHMLFLNYGPDYELSVTASMIPNDNDQETIAKNLNVVLNNIEKIS